MSNSINSISIIGLGYIGLPTAAILANHGVKIVGVDIDQQTVSAVNSGRVSFGEPELAAMVDAAVKDGLLRATVSAEPADAFIIAVPTPLKDDFQPDTSYIERAARSIANCLQEGNLVLLESTSPVGTTEKMEKWFAEERPDLSFPSQAGDDAQIQIAYCPERVLPGRVISEIIENDRVVGGISRYCAERAADLYRIFVKGECLITDVRTAEMCKLAENSFRDVNIAFANELSLICDEHNIDIWELLRLANRHPRVDILKPGPGVGGHCIAVDPWFIVSGSPQRTNLIRSARSVNDNKPLYVINQIQKQASSINGPIIACLGLSFKANVADLRESPSVAIVKKLALSGEGKLLLVEPNIDTLPSELADLPQIELTAIDEALDRANMVVLLVDHRQFRQLDKQRLKGKRIIDTRGIWQ